MNEGLVDNQGRLLIGGSLSLPGQAFPTTSPSGGVIAGKLTGGTSQLPAVIGIAASVTFGSATPTEQPADALDFVDWESNYARWHNLWHEPTPWIPEEVRMFDMFENNPTIGLDSEIVIATNVRSEWIKGIVVPARFTLAVTPHYGRYRNIGGYYKYPEDTAVTVKIYVNGVQWAHIDGSSEWTWNAGTIPFYPAGNPYEIITIQMQYGAGGFRWAGSMPQFAIPPDTKQ